MAENRMLTVDNLKVSFKTRNGNVQAVRNISFTLDKGETLAIVGESGSGKSQTSRSILGILANNAIVESGRIIYNGQDLLKIDEDHMHRIRGDKIAMIFQDPMSSLNPIMRIGKQLTEAMILKNRASRRSSRKGFNVLLAKILETFNRIEGTDVAVNKTKCGNFNKFEFKHLELEGAYNNAKEACLDASVALEKLIFLIEKNACDDFNRHYGKIYRNLTKTVNPFLVSDFTPIKEAASQIQKAKKDTDLKPYLEPLKQMKTIVDEAMKKSMPNFFSLGYYQTFVKNVIPEYATIEEMNAALRVILDKEFMLDFISELESALKITNKDALEASKAYITKLDEYLAYLDQTSVEAIVADRKEKEKWVLEGLRETIDFLDIYNASPCYTFKTSLDDLYNKVTNGLESNIKENKRFASQTAKHQKIIEKGKVPTWEVAPLNIWDVDANVAEIKLIVNEIKAYLQKTIADNANVDFNKRAVDIIDHLKELASNVVFRVTKELAKYRAIKLMEEVGIPEPEKRYRQYPFEFSGGMRQRIVIAIALAANPDILICDEPTTALDVTIQAQILELINNLKAQRNLSIIFITHNLGVVANMADKIAVMYAGKIVEIGTSEDIFYNPLHPYTWALLSSMPDLDTQEKLEVIPGTPPNMIYPPKGDAFAERNKYAMKIDYEMEPPFFEVSETHKAATWLLHPNAPKVNPPKQLLDRIERMKKKSAGEK